jgi:trigger factor
MNLNFTVSEPKPWKRVFEIEVPAASIQTELDEAYGRYRKEMRIPGFRQGKVPLSVLKARFGKEIRAEVLERKIPEYLNQAREEADIDPISQPVIEDISFEDGEDLKVRAVLEVKPSIELKQYKDLQVIKKVAQVTDENIDRSLDALRERYANVVRVDGAAEKDHFLMADLQHLDSSGVPIIGRKEEGQFFQIGTERLGEAFDKQLVGVKADEERRIDTVYPDDYAEEDLAGQQGHFLIKVRDVLEKQLPILDDAFAVDVGAKDLDDLKQSVKEEMEQEPDRDMRTKLLEQIVADYDFEVPESMLKAYLDQSISEARSRARDQEIDEEAMRQEYRPAAVDQIKRYLLLDAIADEEQIEVTKEELDGSLERIAERGQMPVDQIRRTFRDNGRLERIESDIREEKVVEFLVQHADIQVE